MVIDPQHEATLTEALRLLRDAKSLVDQISDETHERSGRPRRAEKHGEAHFVGPQRA
jgi:hypothetical protein